MNRDENQSDPLLLAQMLEEKVKVSGATGEPFDSKDEVPQDFDLALQGLDLIQRAFQNNQAKSAGLEKNVPERDRCEIAPATPRWDAAGVETPNNAAVAPPGPSFEPGDARFKSTLPRSIGRFEIERELGRGGFGVVLLGRDPELDRWVAIKIPRLEMLVDENARRRFDREACLVSTLSHPAIVPVYEYSSGPGVPYIALAWCRGSSLAEWCSRRSDRVAPPLAAQIIGQLAGAVQYAHQRGVIHRDLKPANVLLDWGAEQRGVEQEQDRDLDLVAALRITDFGLAKTMQSDLNSLTRDGAMVGTPSYMSPEQIHGQGEITAAADIYSLGAILYELLTGSPPLRRDTDLATMRAVEHEEPVPPRRLRPDIPRDLEAIVLKCLEKNPASRYVSAFELQQDLDHWLAGRTVTARRATMLERTVRWVRRQPALAALSAVTALAMGSALTASLVGWYSTSQALAREQVARQEADQAYQDSKSAIDQYFVSVSENQLLTTPGMKTLRQELLQNAVGWYSSYIERHRDDGDLAWDLAIAQTHRAIVEEELGQLPEARLGFEQALQMLDQLRERDSTEPKFMLQTALTLRKLARLDRLNGDLPAAIEKLEQAQSWHQSLLNLSYEPATNRGELGLVIRDQANLRIAMGKLDEACQLHAESEQHFLEALLLEPDRPMWSHMAATAQGSQATIALQQGQIDRAEAGLLASANRLHELVDQYPEQLVYQLDWGKALANLSMVQAGLQRLNEAVETLQSASQIFDRLALAHPQVVIYQALRASTRRNAAQLLTRLDRWAECESWAVETIEILSSVTGEPGRHPSVQQELGLTQVLLGRVYQQQGLRDAAREQLSSGLAVLERDLQSTPGNLVIGQAVAETLQQLALVDRDPAMAKQYLDRSQALVESLLAARPDNAELQGTLRVIAETRALLNDRGTDEGGM